MYKPDLLFENFTSESSDYSDAKQMLVKNPEIPVEEDGYNQRDDDRDDYVDHKF